MAGTAKPPNGKKWHPMPTEQDLIAFNHVAAGHEGMSSNAAGSLVIKPCTQAEIDFYESAKDHELFQAHMPIYMGTLALNQDQSAADLIAPLLAQVAPPVAVHGANRGNVIALPPINEMLSPLFHGSASSTTTVTSGSAKRVSWKPSGGKKLNTGLAIVLENVAAGFTHPNILDVKLGARLWADDAPASKRRKLDDVSKETTSGSLGFRIAGMKMWNDTAQAEVLNKLLPQEAKVEVKDGYRIYNRHYGRTFTAVNVKDGFAEYMGGLEDDKAGKPRLKRMHSKMIAQRMIRDLESMEYILEREESQMYSASVLMIYEGDEEALEESIRDEEMRETAEKENTARGLDLSTSTQYSEDDGSDEDDGEDEDDDDDDDDDEPPKVLDVRLIDFAHASWTPGLGPDENVLQGLRSVIRILRDLVKD